MPELPHVPDKGIAVIRTDRGMVYALLLTVTKSYVDVAGVKFSRHTLRRLGWKGHGSTPQIVGWRKIKARIPGPLVVLTLPTAETGASF